MDIWSALLLGIVEGFTEFLPISSTGHLILASKALGIPQTEFQKSFEIIIQSGAILAVVALYFHALLNVEMLKKLFIGFLPTGAIGLALYPLVKAHLIGNEIVVLTALFLGGIVLIAFELLHKEGTQESLESITYTQAALIGLFQAVAIIPGVSRSAATIVGGMLLGMRRTLIVEFSFLIAIPTMVAATSLDFLQSADTILDGNLGMLALGFVVSCVVAMISITFLLAFVRRYSFIPFGVYRIVLSCLVLALLIV